MNHHASPKAGDGNLELEPMGLLFLYKIKMMAANANAVLMASHFSEWQRQ